MYNTLIQKASYMEKFKATKDNKKDRYKLYNLVLFVKCKCLYTAVREYVRSQELIWYLDLS